MPTIQRSAIIEYSAEQMFDLVNDIERYPTYLPSCKSATVISESPSELVGELCLAKAGIKQCFTTRNQLERPTLIRMELVKGDFSRFRGHWEFESLADEACRFGIDVRFEFRSALLGLAAERLLSNVLSDLVDAMVNRAHELYGR